MGLVAEINNVADPTRELFLINERRVIWVFIIKLSLD
jgi:hypothetical protein